MGRPDQHELELAEDLAPSTFEIRRRAGLYLTAAVVPLVLAAGFGVLSLVEGQRLLAVPGAVLLVLSFVATSGLKDVRTPLFVADDHGVRMRDGRVWVGLLWSEIVDARVEDAQVVVVAPDADHVHAAPIGFTTTASADQVREQLARRRGPPPY